MGIIFPWVMDKMSITLEEVVAALILLTKYELASKKSKKTLKKEYKKILKELGK